MTWLVMAKFLAVMCSVGAADVCWTRYMQGVAAKEPFLAGMWSAAIVVIGSISIVAYVSSPAYLIPAGLGAFIGTYFSVRRGPN